MLHEDGSHGEWEQRRLEALHRLNILDTLPEEHFEFLIHFVARTFEVPIAAISLVDEQRLWFKACFGLGMVREYKRKDSFCAQALYEPELMVVENAAKDPRFADVEMVSGKFPVCFYAGAPLYSLSRLPLGTLCIFDVQPRRFSHRSRALLVALAAIVARELNHDVLPRA